MMRNHLITLRLPFAGLLLTLSLITGCSHSQKPAPTATGSPEALDVVDKLQSQNTRPPAVSGIFTWTTTQPQDAHFAERVVNGNLPLAYYEVAATMPAAEDPQGARLRRYVADVLKDGPPKGTYTAVSRYEQRQQDELFYVSCTSTSDGKDEHPLTISAWNGDIGYSYQPSTRWAQRSTNYPEMLRWYGSPVPVRSFSWHIPFPSVTGQVTLRNEQVDGENLVVLHEDLGKLYREYYLSPKQGYAPKRIVQRMKEKRAMPEGGITGTIEYETGKWPFRSRKTQRTTTPAEPLKFLDWNHGAWDSDTTITAIARRPDGQWFVTGSTTTYPFFRRTETFKAEKLSFAPLPASAFEVEVPPDVQIRH